MIDELIERARERYQQAIRERDRAAFLKAHKEQHDERD